MSPGRPPDSRGKEPKGRILVVEDSPDMTQLLRTTLRGLGYTVSCAKDGESALRAVRARNPILVVLDIGLPGMDGFDVLKSLRAQGGVPVIILTGSRQAADCLVGLKLGADDYMIKPISMPELAARIEAVLKRSRPGPPPPQVASAETRGALRLDSRTHEVLNALKPVELEPKEFNILQLLLRAHGRVVGRRELLRQVWGYTKDLGMDPRMVDQVVSRLRRKLKDAGRKIVTVPTLGYKIKL